jgi:hypothetical protein
VTEEQESLSDFWRKRTSSHLPEELANVLVGARGYIGFFGSDYSVEWGSGSSVSLKSKDVILDFAPLKDKTPPFDGKDIDQVMGTAIHESGHIKWSYPKERVKNYLYSKRASYNRTDVYELETIANIIEDFYVENKISETYPTLGAYLREARKLSAIKELPHNLFYDLSTDNPSFDSLLTMWGAITLIDKTIPSSASKTSKKILNKLVDYTIASCNAKPNRRLKISYKIWEELKAFAHAKDKEQQRYNNMLKQEQEQNQKHEQSSGEGDGEQSNKSEEDTSPEEESQPQNENKETPSNEHEEEHEQQDESSDREDKHVDEDSDDTEHEDSDQEDNDEDTETGDSTEIDEDTEESFEEDVYEPYLDHRELRECYSFDLDNKQLMPSYMVDAVDEYLETKPENIGSQVREILGGAGTPDITMKLAERNPAKVNKLFLETRMTAQKVSQLFMQDKRLRTRYRRGLLDGAVDPRRLYKAGASDYKLFERREVLSAPSLAVGVLIDASGSMGGGYSYLTHIGDLERAITIGMALKTALTMIENVDLMIMAYNTDSGTTLHRIYDRKSGEFRPGVKAIGGTPSGYAIAGMVSQIGRYLKGKDKLIIHITDGVPDSHDDVKNAVDYCLANGIDVMTLAMSIFSDVVVDSYHGLCEYINNFDKLPEAIASLLKKRLQKRMMRIK